MPSAILNFAEEASRTWFAKQERTIIGQIANGGGLEIEKTTSLGT
jgi:hypothetical protein